MLKEFNRNIFDFYSYLDDCHKIYFLLTLKDINLLNEEYSKELELIVSHSIQLQNPYLKGFSFKIKFEINKDNSFFKDIDNIHDILASDNIFLKTKNGIQ